ncbi:uncharacterized protein LOC130291692 isoform X2 [Hyla sarda]|uniref:uncharacterized protein LOC130291692 isoform X2 n=1 Tax=Hyla sarda TaxID=327740 RepID=UPI0024C33D53|nr:uncharacterized protein LOC130291692 isoform X2 [Hyla sarda]
MIQDAVDFCVILVLGLVACSVSGCSISQSLSLSLFPTNGDKALECHLCLGKRTSLRGSYTFTLTRNGKMVKFSQITIPRTWYALERKKNNTGRWRCEVKEFPDLWAEYDLEPSIPTSPAEKEKDTEETSVPASTMSTRILLTILTAVLLLIICIIVICVTLGFCIMRRSSVFSRLRGTSVAVAARGAGDGSAGFKYGTADNEAEEETGFIKQQNIMAG